ncbi:MAG: hypothetical protein EOP34_11285 [Rickettsiales bacterium]|jgi:hypothetical protein|nr:MAG: hypothetical protein EOP34_11285 [Rickettsiales bacterium]
MQNKFIYSHQYLSNILGTLNHIKYEFLNHPITTYCVIYLIVFLTLLGIVLFAEQRTKITVKSLLYTKTDLEDRANDNIIGLNFGFQQNLPGLGTDAFLFDINDSTGLRMARLLPDRTFSSRRINGVNGFAYKTSPNYSTGVNSQENLLIHVNNNILDYVDSVRPILTRGLTVQRAPFGGAYPVTVLTILPVNNRNSN